MTRYAGRRARLALLVSTLAAFGWSAAPASAAGSYAVNVAPGAATAGARPVFAVTVTSVNGSLTSADITLPPSFANASAPAPATVSGSTVQLRNLRLSTGDSVTVAVTADVPCSTASTSNTWSTVARGGGSQTLDLVTAQSQLVTQVGAETCSLAFRPADQPAGAAIAPTRITTAPYDPTGGPVRVTVLDGGGQQVTTTADRAASVSVSLAPPASSMLLTGTTTRTASGGVASFGDLAISTPGDYRLAAAATSASTKITGATSQTFRIVQSASACKNQNQCSTSATGSRNNRVDVSAPTIGVGSWVAATYGSLQVDCEASFGYRSLTAPGQTAVVDGFALGVKTVTLTIDKYYMKYDWETGLPLPNNGASFIEICFGSPQPPADASQPYVVQGTYDWNADGATADSEKVYVWILPDCSAAVTGPCIVSQNKTGAGNGQIVERIPLGYGDPANRP